MRCKDMKEDYSCKRDGKRCVAHYRTERGNEEGINDSILRVSSCYDGPGKLVFPNRFKSNLVLGG